MKGVEVIPVLVQGKDERGITTELDVFGRSGPFIFATRVKGSVSGNHYHKGLSASKNPELVYLLQGKVRIEFASIPDGNPGEMKETLAEAPCRIVLNTHVWHRFHFLEDSLFLELNSFADGNEDSFRAPVV